MRRLRERLSLLIRRYQDDTSDVRGAAEGTACCYQISSGDGDCNQPRTSYRTERSNSKNDCRSDLQGRPSLVSGSRVRNINSWKERTVKGGRSEEHTSE